MVLHHSHDEQPFYVLVVGCLNKNILLCTYFGKDHGCKMKWSSCKDLLLFLRSIMDAEGNGVPANLCMVLGRMLHAE
jgi:hypothetical protein